MKKAKDTTVQIKRSKKRFKKFNEQQGIGLPIWRQKIKGFNSMSKTYFFICSLK